MLADEEHLPVNGHSPDSGKVDYRRWESGFIPDLNFTQTSEHNFAYGAHVHDLMEIIWVLSGSSEIVCRDRSYTMHRGDAVIIAPNEVHAGGSYDHSSFSFATLQIPRTLVEMLFGYNYLYECVSPVLLVDGCFAETLYRELIYGLPKTLSLTDQLTCLDDVLGRLFHARHSVAYPAVGTRTCHPAVRQAKSIINESYTESIDFCRLATEVKLHQRYLISLFKSMTGIPPHQYQIALRVDLARRLLESKLSLSNVASSAGFADQSHLNRHFKRIYNQTPGEFREHTIPM